jgi:glycosyltransferase involved in cell wall biosynthesis
MHIALFSPSWPLSESSPNGIVTYVHILRSEFLNRGHRVSVFTNVLFSGGKTEVDTHLIEATISHRVLQRLNYKRDYSFVSWGRMLANKINAVHRVNPIDVIEMEESFGWCADVLTRTGIPVVVKLHGPAFLSLVEEELNTAVASMRIDKEGRGLEQMPSVISPSSDTLRKTRERYNLHPDIEMVIPNPVLFDPNPSLWNIDNCDRKTILFVGRFDKRKGGDVMLRAFRRLLDFDSGIRLLFVGPDVGLSTEHGAPISFVEFRDSLFSEEQRSRIDFSGQLPQSHIAALRTRAMLTIVASRWDNQPNTVLEAMMQGCPVVATDNGGVSEVVEHNVTGLLAWADDPQDLCDKIMSLLLDASKAQKLGQNARRFVTDRHCLKHIADKTMDTYLQTVRLIKRGL